MREIIKFRAWDTEEKVMWQPLTLNQIIRADWEFETDPYEYTLPWKDYMWSQHDKTVWMQYTGLKDKNGKEIYEGDICRYHSPVSGDNDIIYSVNLDGEKARFCERSDGATYDGSFIRSGKSEIIGNIYENPELLK